MMEVILVARGVLFACAVVCLGLHTKSLWCLWAGSQSLRHRGSGHIALVALSAILAQPYYLDAVDAPVVLLLALLLASMGFGLAIQTSIQSRLTGLDKRLDDMIDRPDLSLPLVELAELDEAAAKALAQEARIRIAGKRALQSCR